MAVSVKVPDSVRMFRSREKLFSSGLKLPSELWDVLGLLEEGLKVSDFASLAKISPREAVDFLTSLETGGLIFETSEFVRFESDESEGQELEEDVVDATEPEKFCSSFEMEINVEGNDMDTQLERAHQETDVQWEEGDMIEIE